MARAVVQFSGGVGSWAAARRTITKYGRESTVLLFADVKMEDEDLYRFLDEASSNLGVPITRIADGRTPWELFRDEKFIGNTRVDLCSRELKRDLLRTWIKANCDPAETVIVLGIDWTEIERFDTAQVRWAETGFAVWAPLCEETHTDKESLLAELAAAGIAEPRLYGMGFPHNNCGGFCVKAGHSQFYALLKKMPERYAWHEEQEQITRVHIGKNVAVLRDRRGGETRPMTMATFRERVEGGYVPRDDWGGCGCALE